MFTYEEAVADVYKRQILLTTLYYMLYSIKYKIVLRKKQYDRYMK